MIASATPIHFVSRFRHPMPKTRCLPFMRTFGQAVPHGIVMDVIQMVLKIRWVLNRVLPESSLPNFALTMAGTRDVERLEWMLFQCFGEQRFDSADALGEIRIVGRKCPHPVQVIG